MIVMNFVTTKVVWWVGCGGLVENLSGTEVEQQSATKIISLTLVNLVSPKARACSTNRPQQTDMGFLNV